MNTFPGARTADGLVSEGMKATNALVKERKSGGGGNNGNKTTERHLLNIQCHIAYS